MDDSWLSVAETAHELGISAGRVRGLLSDGALGGRKLQGIWFINPQDVQRRAAHSQRSGRPLSPNNAWRMLALLDQLSQESAASARLASEAVDDSAERWLVQAPPGTSAVDRSRLRALVANLPSANGLARKLSSRAQLHRVRAHPGVIDRLLADERVSVGGGRAVAERGGGVADSGRSARVYLAAVLLKDFAQQYRLEDDTEGNVELAVVPAGVSPSLLPACGKTVPLAVAWADLLDDPDSRARYAAQQWLAQLPRHAVLADGRRR